MSIIGIDIGSSTTKMIEFENGEIKSKRIIRRVYERNDLDLFIKENNIKIIETNFRNKGVKINRLIAKRK